MHKKIVTALSIIIILLIGAIALLIFNTKGNLKNVSNKAKNNNTENKETNNNTSKPQNVAVIYFSATGTTKTIAEKIHKLTEGDIIEILPNEPYSEEDLNYNNENSRATREQKDPSMRPAIANQIDTDKYSIIYLGYPIWWGDVPKIILTFLDSHNFENKTIIPFCTSESSSIDTSIDTLKKYNDKVNWIPGKRFSSTSKESEIEKWFNNL